MGLIIICIVGIVIFSIFIGIGIGGLNSPEEVERILEEERMKAQHEAEMRLPTP